MAGHGQVRLSLSINEIDTRNGRASSLQSIEWNKWKSSSSHKMQILKLSRKLSILCGVCSSSPVENGFRAKFGQTLNVAFVLINFIMLQSSNISNALHQLKMGNIVELFFACLQATGNISALLSYISIVYQRQNTRKVFNRLQTIVDERKFRVSNLISFSRQSIQFPIFLDRRT